MDKLRIIIIFSIIVLYSCDNMEVIVGTAISILVPRAISVEYDTSKNIITSCDNKDIQDVTIYIRGKEDESWKNYWDWYLKDGAEGKQFFLLQKNSNYINDLTSNENYWDWYLKEAAKGKQFYLLHKNPNNISISDSLIFHPNSIYLIRISALHSSAEIYLFTNNIGVVDSVKNDRECM